MGAINATKRVAPELGEWAIHPGRKCAAVDPELFFPVYGGSAEEARAKTLCRMCPVKTPCREYALEAVPLVEGIWGATNATDRQRIRYARIEEQMAGAA